MSDLNPSAFVDDWESYKRALHTWLGTGDLERVVLEVFNKTTGALIVRWDIDIVYSWSGGGGFWTDTDQLKYHLRKAGVAPSDASYDIKLKTKPGRPDVPGAQAPIGPQTALPDTISDRRSTTTDWAAVRPIGHTNVIPKPSPSRTSTGPELTLKSSLAMHGGRFGRREEGSLLKTA